MPASQDGSCSFWQDIKAYLSSEKFGQLLSVIDEISWQLEQGSAPSPLHLYMDALSQKKRSDKVLSARKLLAAAVRKRGNQEASPILSPELFPSFEGRAIYTTIASIPKAPPGTSCNVEVHFVGPGLEATLVATQRLEAGEGLLL